MSNLGPREKYLIILLGIGILILAIYLVGIKRLQDTNYNLEIEQQQLQAKLDYYKALQASNEEITNAIAEMDNQIKGIERTFIPVINTEALEEYVLSVFAENGCPYLSGVSTQSVQSPAFLLPDGSVAEDTLNIKRVAVVYTTTDGFNVPDFNRQVSLIDPETGRLTEDEAVIDEFLEQIKWQGSDSIVGYDEFLAALAAIKEENPSCIKITSITVESVGGYLTMSAGIDFFSAYLTQRVSDTSSTAPYVVWNRDSADETPTGAGMIGLPLYVDNPDNAWYGFYSPVASYEHPFANGFSSLYFNALTSSVGMPTAIDLEGENDDAGITTGDNGDDVEVTDEA